MKNLLFDHYLVLNFILMMGGYGDLRAVRGKKNSCNSGGIEMQED